MSLVLSGVVVRASAADYAEGDSLKAAGNAEGRDSMPADTLPLITAAVAPVVMVSAAGLLFLGIQTKNLHLADRIRALTAEYRGLPVNSVSAARRDQLATQLGLFERRLRLSQRALEFLLAALLIFVLTSLLLATGAWPGNRIFTVGGVVSFVGGVECVFAALLVEFLEMRTGLRTIDLEMQDIRRHRSQDP